MTNACVAAALLALAAGCAKDALSLSPFPCAADDTCPSGLVCVPGKGCVKPQADAICATKDDCASIGANATCDQGRCELTCSNTSPCTDSTRYCSGTVSGVCLQDCSAGQACGSDLVCQDAWGKKACLPAGKGQGSSCPTESAPCGPLGVPAVCAGGRCEMSCVDGAGCSAGRICSATKGAGVCLQDCTAASAACATGTTCSALFDGAHKACLASNIAGLDQPCTTEGASCGPLGSGGYCSAGRCQIKCSAGAGCPSGRTCSSSTGAGVCLVDCTSSACPGDLTCNGPWGTNAKKYCVASGQGVESVSSCASAPNGTACGPLGLGGVCDAGVCTLACKDGAGCAAGYLCSAAAGSGVCMPDCTAQGATCPAGLTCSSLFTTTARACLPSSVGLDKACAGADGTACGPTGAGGVCISGRCDVACSSATACPAGRACSSTTTAPGVCLIDCTAGASACPSDLACAGPYASGKSYCSAPGAGLFASCTAATSTACGPKGLNAACDVGECLSTCANGAGCPTGQFCSAATGTGSCLLDCSAQGFTCPGGTTCNTLWNGSKACLAPSVGQDKTCSQEGASCGPRGSGAVCTLGICVAPCGPSAACPGGRVCTVGSAQSGGVCVQDCTADPASCTNGLMCEGLWHDGKSGCVAAGHSLQACKSIATSGQCTFCSSTDDRYFTVKCPDGNTCVANSTCTLNSSTNKYSCTCDSGFTAYSCTGALCSNFANGCAAPASPCTSPNGCGYWCRPSTPPPAPTCSDTNTQVSASCTCVDGRSLPMACGSSGSCEYYCSTGCDVVTQACPGGTDKCTLLADTGTNSVVAGCTPPLAPGLGTEGQSCQRASTDPTAVGHDDCAKGYFCTQIGSPTNALTCQKLCHQDAQCTAGQKCFARNGRTPEDGTCVQACSLGTACANGLSCAAVAIDTDEFTWFGLCRAASGGKGIGATCSQDSDCVTGFPTYPGAFCGTNHVSTSTGVCTPLCDSSHACPSGYTCKPLYGLASGGGYCF